MTSKTKEFKLNEIIQFNNESIHFFNINPYNSSIYISLEINGKRMKLDYSDKIILKEIFQNENKEINYNIINDIELNMKFKLINKFNKKEIFESFQTKLRESKVKWNQNKLNEGGAYGSGISIKDRVKMFSGGENAKKQNAATNFKPGKLKMPNIFKKSGKDNSNIGKDDAKKSIKKDSLKNNNKIENNNIIKINEKENLNNDKIVGNNNIQKTIDETHNNNDLPNKKQENENEINYDVDNNIKGRRNKRKHRKRKRSK